MDDDTNLSGIYISISRLEDSFLLCDIESAVVIFVYKYLLYTSETHIPLHMVIDNQQNGTIKIDSDFVFSVHSKKCLDMAVKNCCFPAYYQRQKKYCFAGICAVLRQIVKTSETNCWLLGFRDACLSACAEFSVWTKFCEVDLIGSIKKYLREPLKEIPIDIIRLEYHLGQPVRTHNIRKQSSRFPSSDGIVQHTYVEGPEMYLSDLIVIPLVYTFFHIYELNAVRQAVPLVCKWYELMLSDPRIYNCLAIISIPPIENTISQFVIPSVKVDSLYKCDPRRYKTSEKIFTKQEDVEHVIDLIDAMGVLMDYDYLQNEDKQFKWDEIPYYAHPKGGNLPEDRLSRKMQQIENVVMAVLRIAREGDTIVDFCCGVGHVGILIAYLLPKCRVLLLDNKEYSLRRALDRIVNLNLQNVFIVQSNIDYFQGTFQVGVTLHACGVATDLVMKACISNRSKFVISPCCYGKLQENHILHYPRSERYSVLTVREYMVAAHGADQTHKDEYSKSDQGEKCMKIVDVDRCFHAKETGYRVYIAKMKPITCSPKNNFIVGVPQEQFLSHYFP